MMCGDLLRYKILNLINCGCEIIFFLTFLIERYLIISTLIHQRKWIGLGANNGIQKIFLYEISAKMKVFSKKKREFIFLSWK